MVRRHGIARSQLGGRGSIPKHPYRDSAVFHVALGAVILAVAWLTGGDLTRAIVVALGYIAVAIGWSWYRFRKRIGRAAAAGTEGKAGH